MVDICTIVTPIVVSFSLPEVARVTPRVYLIDACGGDFVYTGDNVFL